MRISAQEFRQFVIAVSFTISVASASYARAEDTITGVVRNQTTGNLATGDEVILLSLDQGMREEARALTDVRGSFRLTVQHPGQPYLVRVIHQGVNYDERALTGEAVSIDVYNAGEKVNGVTGTIEIVRVETKDAMLHVSDMVEIGNSSNPPVTQTGKHTFETRLPARAHLDSVFAAGPGTGAGKIAVLISAEPVDGRPGAYSVNFPLRPGVTKFAVNYDVPYDGRVAFAPQLSYSLKQFAVMTPLTMKFTAHSSSGFMLLPTQDKGYHVYAASNVKQGTGPSFEISGAGVLPDVRFKEAIAAKPSVAFHSGSSSATARNLEAADSAKVITAAASLPAASEDNSWVLMAVAVTVLGFCGFVFVYKQRLVSKKLRAAADTPAAFANIYSEALKDEMLQLEIDRSQGTISGEEYNSVRWALERTSKRVRAQT